MPVPVDTVQASYRAALLLARWARRARQQLLQDRAAELGLELRLRAALRQLRRWRASKLAKWHKQMSAKLHCWSVLMRLVLAAWRGWHALHIATQLRRDAALQSRADRLCAWCLGGWRRYVGLRWRARGALLHFAAVLEQRCLHAWATWTAARAIKRPEKERRARTALLTSLRSRWRQWAAAAERRGVDLLQDCAASRLAADAAVEHAFSLWGVARLRAVRRSLLTRRAYVFMAMRLSLRVLDAWRGLPVQRAALDALVPRAASRLGRLHTTLRLHQWRRHAHRSASTSATLVSRRAAVERAGALGAARTLFASCRIRGRRVAALREAASHTRALAARSPWDTWRHVYARRVAAREAASQRSRGFRLWARRSRWTRFVLPGPPHRPAKDSHPPTPTTQPHRKRQKQAPCVRPSARLIAQLWPAALRFSLSVCAALLSRAVAGRTPTISLGPRMRTCTGWAPRSPLHGR